MSMADLAAALIGLRESSSRDQQRVASGLDELRGTLGELRSEVETSVDKRLAASAQALRDLEKRLLGEYERRYEAALSACLEVAERLSQLADSASSSTDPAELSERLASLAGPRDRLLRLLEEAGIRQFDSVGEPYDPLRHEVVQREVEPGCQREYVKSEVKPGYVREGLDHTMVRAKVIVAAPSMVEDRADG